MIYKKFHDEIDPIPLNSETSESSNTFKNESELIGTAKDKTTERNTNGKSNTIDFSIDQPSNTQPEQMIKKALLKEIENQQRKITTSKNKLDSENVRSTPVKRKRNLTTGSKKTAMKKARYNFDDVKKELFLETDRKRKKNMRKNQDEAEKAKERNLLSKRMKNLRKNQD